MSAQHNELEDIDDLIEDLTHEKRKRGVWVGVFMGVTALMFLAVIIYFAWMMVVLTSVAADLHGDWMSASDHLIPFLAMVPLFGGALTSLSGWKAQSDCQQSLDMAIKAARKFSDTGRSKTLSRRLKLIECANKEKRRMWRDVVGLLLN